ncbi:hypothetical protein H072_1090 [Dactylellina haptotyla CBS 200.50]|uniref:tyrosinase n=1 Tax=Dactylellina haptotyla (strain CBS 200.50) TaxID=1284197 RepID=S8BZR0_DACHA|nr:hypothetical protein H072_1090 [Dactylellina haptotyla CBS 200.50]
MKGTSFALQTLVSVLSLNAAISSVSAVPLDSEADWLFAANNFVKRDTVAKRAGPPSPVQPGQPTNCNMWKYIQTSDTCSSLAVKYKDKGLTEQVFLNYNPAAKVSGKCSLKQKVYVCISTRAAPTPTPKGPGVKAVSTSSAAPVKSAEGEVAVDEPSTSSAAPSASASAKAAAGGDDDDDDASPTSASAGGDDKATATKASGAWGKIAGPSGTQIVGAGAGTCAERQNINTMQTKQPDVFNLLVLALSQMQLANGSDPLSYYGLSSIHGAPYAAWPDPTAQGDYDPKYGYCTHRSILFATWHRPYMLALEQTVWQTGVQIANTFSGADKTKYVAASKLLRWPYWDWADKDSQSSVPACAMTPTIKVMKPGDDGSATEAEIDNPFYAYRFKEGEGTFLKAPFTGLKQTNRRPRGAQGTSLDAAANTAMQSGFATRRKLAFTNLASEKGFNYFSNQLENMHNDVHVQMGGNGIMSYISYAAFDPIFWLHHNNIDRMLAIWQAANPGVYLEADAAVPTFQRHVGDGVKDGMDTQLYPWKHPDGSWWTSNDVKDVTSIWGYGYGYPEVPCSYKGKSSSELDDFATSQINTLYNDDADANTKLKGRATSKATTSGSSTTEWAVNILVDQSELPGTFAIYAFMGMPPSDITKWDNCDHKISTLSLLGAPGVKRMSRVEAMEVPLNPMLKKKGFKGNTKQTEDYLNKNLIWACLNIDTAGTAKLVDVKKMRSLKVAVTSTNVTTTSDKKKKPKYGDAVISTASTKNNVKIGGATSANELVQPKRLDGKQQPLRKGILKIVAPKKSG